MKIIITGAAGIIGRVLTKCLGEQHELAAVDKVAAPGVTELDLLAEPDRFRELARGRDAIIHLAWNVREAGTDLEPVLPENKAMGELVFRVALEEGIPRVILASSAHASLGFVGYRYPGIVADHGILHAERKIGVRDGFFPLGAYGASKVYLEALGKAYAAGGLGVIAIRFGNVTRDNGYGEYPFWLSRRDCCQFVGKCVTAQNLPAFSSFFAISNNACNPFDLSEAENFLGYEPQDGSPCPFERI